MTPGPARTGPRQHGSGMGNGQGRSIGGRLSKKDVERLQRRFVRLAKGEPRVRISEFQTLVELGGNPFVPLLFEMFDTNGDGTLSIDEFTQALEYFGQLDSQEEQYKFAFRIYDRDKDGRISSEELFNVLQKLLGSTYPETQLEQVVQNTMDEFDADGDSKLSLEEFVQLLSATDLQNKLSLSL